MTLTGENRSTRSKPRTSASLSTKNFTRTGPSSNQGLRNDRKATDRLSHGQYGLSSSSYFLSSSSFFSFLFVFFFFLLFFTSVLNGSSTVTAHPTTIQRYYPNGHSRHTIVYFNFAYRPVYELLSCCRIERDTESDSSHVSADVTERSAEGDSPSGNEGTGDNGDISTDTKPGEDVVCTEDTADDETDTR